MHNFILLDRLHRFVLVRDIKMFYIGQNRSIFHFYLKFDF
jgi:hypothetical protein